MWSSVSMFDTNNTQEETATAIVKAVAGMHPGPDVFLYVLTIGRFTDEDESVYNQLLSLFDKKVVKYTIVVFTGGDKLKDSGKPIQEILQTAPANLTNILHSCKHRFVVFNNKAADKLSQVTDLLQTARALVRENGGAPYSCPKYVHIGKTLEEEVARRVKQGEKIVQELEAQLIQTKKTLDREMEEFQKREKARQQEMAGEEDVRNAQVKSMEHMFHLLHMSQERMWQEEKALRRKLEKELE